MAKLKKAAIDTSNETVLIAVFRNGSQSMAKLDWSFLNLKVISLESPQFKKYLKEVCDKQLFEGIFREFEELVHPPESGYHPHRYAFVPIDITDKSITEASFHYIERILLLLFPTEFQITEIFNFYSRKGKLELAFWTYWDGIYRQWVSSKKGFQPVLLFVQNSDRKKVSEFIKFSYPRSYDSKSYLSLALRSYHSAFKQETLIMAYISLCICLESLIKSQSEITFRICRLCAVIHSKTKDEGKIILKNVNILYDFRSRIVHGENYDLDDLAYNFHILEALVSKTLIKLIALTTINNRDDLSQLINSIGYGDFPKDSKTKFNTQMEELILKEAKKWKEPK